MNGRSGDGRPQLREAAIAVGYLLLVAIGVVTVLWPALEDADAGPGARPSVADAGT